MTRTVYIIRHGTSEGTRHNQASFGPEGGALEPRGIQEAKALRKKLQDLGIEVQKTPVASSFMKRAHETALYAGFKQINMYESLNEVGSDLLPEVLDAMLDRKEAPPSAIAAARELLKNPPVEEVWITHGQLIAGISHALGIPTSELFIPAMGSITKIELP